MRPHYMVDENVIEAAMARLQQAAPRATVILFGSYARGAEGPNSDLDFLVVEDEIEDRIKEAGRLHEAVREVLRDYLIGVDIVPMRRADFEKSKDAINTLAYEAAHEGKVYSGAA